MAQVSRKRVHWGWMLYDFASQPFHTLLITFIFAPYFAATVASSPEQGQAMWGYAIGTAGLVIAIAAPFLGAFADTTGPRKPWIVGFSVFYLLGSALLWFAVPGSPDAVWILVAFCIGLIGVEFMTTFTNAMLPEIAEKDEIGQLSGSGWGFGYVGGLIALVIMLLFIAENDKGVTLLGNPPILGLDPEAREGTRAVGPLTAIWFLVFMIPFFMWVPDTRRRERKKGAVAESLRGLLVTVKSLPSRPSLLSYLMGSMFYRDALNGFYAFGGIYAAGVLKWSIIEIGVFGILAGATGALGAWLGGRADRSFGPRPVLFATIVMLICVAVVALLTSRSSVLGVPVDAASRLPDITFYICGAIIGAAGGALQAASRTMLVHQVSNDRMTEAFGLYALTGRATAFLAPYSIAVITGATGSQQMGLIPIIVLFVIGAALLFYVRPVAAQEVEHAAV